MKFSTLRVGLALAIFCSFPALAQAQQVNGLPGEYTTWRATPPDGTRVDVTYFLVGFSGAQATAFAPALAAAANVWNAAGANVQVSTNAAPHTIFIFNAVPPPSGAPAMGLFPAPPAPPTLFYPDGTGYRTINGVLIQLDGSVPWHTDPTTPLLFGEFDLTSYLIREFGFSLGLGTENGFDPLSVMTALPPGANSTNRVLSAGDIAALQTLYGAPEPATWALFGVGLAALGAAKKSRRRFTPAA